MKRLRISLKRGLAVAVSRISIGKLKFAYVICADKKIKYANGRSKIVYIGTTKKGINRVSQSAAIRSDDVLRMHGVEEFEVRIVTCTPRQRVKTWHKLERALLLTFREVYGTVPKCNSHGKKFKKRDELELFASKRLKTIIEDLS